MIRVRPTVWLFNKAGERKGMVEPVELSCVFRDSGLGSWCFAFDSEHYLASKVSPGWSVLISDGLVSMSGPIDKISIEQGATMSTHTISGKDEMVHLSDRITYPSPNLPITKQTDVSHWKMKGAAADVIAALISASVGPSALEARKVRNVVLDYVRGKGAPVVVEERFTNVLEVVTDISRMGGVTVHGLRKEDGNLYYSISVPRDLSRQVRFFRQSGNGAQGEMSFEAPTATAVIVAAQGEGVDRDIREATEVSVWGRRIEVLKDRRDTSEDDTLNNAGMEELVQGAEAAGASFSVVESESLMFGRDYALGDKITLNAGSIVISERVRQASVKWDGFGRTVELSIGDHKQEDDKNPVWVKHVKSLASRLNNLESR